MKKFTILTLLFASIHSFGQKKYVPEFLIPYNDNGKWGWCDTLGKIIIEPQFQEVGFFDYKGRGAVTVVEADVETNHGYNRYSFPGGLVVPESYTLVNELYNYTDKETRRWFSVQNEDGKFGIFESTNKQMVVKPEWDVIENDSDFEEIIYLKRETEKFYFQFDRLTNKLTKTDIDSIFYTTDPQVSDEVFYLSGAWFFKHLNGSITKLVNGKQILLTPQQKKKLLSSSEMNLGYGTAIDQKGDSFDTHGKTYDHKSKMIDSAACLIGLIQYPAKSHNPFKQYSVIRENGKIGVYDNQGILILPFIYDKITFQNNNEQAILYSGDKVGMKLLIADYKTIEPKFDRIDYYKSLRVNSKWRFLLYEVSIGDNKGLMGENGVEYFHFD